MIDRGEIREKSIVRKTLKKDIEPLLIGLKRIIREERKKYGKCVRPIAFPFLPKVFEDLTKNMKEIFSLQRIKNSQRNGRGVHKKAFDPF